MFFRKNCENEYILYRWNDILNAKNACNRLTGRLWCWVTMIRPFGWPLVCWVFVVITGCFSQVLLCFCSCWLQVDLTSALSCPLRALYCDSAQSRDWWSMAVSDIYHWDRFKLHPRLGKRPENWEWNPRECVTSKKVLESTLTAGSKTLHSGATARKAEPVLCPSSKLASLVLTFLFRLSAGRSTPVEVNFNYLGHWPILLSFVIGDNCSNYYLNKLCSHFHYRNWSKSKFWF